MSIFNCPSERLSSVPTASFVASAFLQLPVALALLVVGAKLHRRSRLSGQPAFAWFAAFWVGIGTYALVEALWSVAWLAGFQRLEVGLFALHMKIVASCVGFAGLVAYLLSIHGRDKRIIAVVVGAYSIVAALAETFYSWRAPVAQEPGVWGMRLLYAVNDTQPWWTLVVLMLFLPPFLAAISYATLLRHARDPAIRYRIALTSASLLLFFAPLAIGWRSGGAPWWGGVEKALGILMTIGIVLALWPPPAVRAWLENAQLQELRSKELVERAKMLV